MISKADFQKFCIDYIAFDIHKMQRFGQAFCNHFKIDDTELFYLKGIKACEDLIRLRYVSAL